MSPTMVFGKRRDVAKSEIEALARERMDEMGGVADERQPLADEAPRDLKAKRERLDARGEPDLAELRGEAQFELAHEVLRVERKQRVRVGAPFVPDDARPAPGQRQDGEGASGQEMLLGAALMVALVRDRGDEAGLVVVPADGRNLGERAQLRARAVRRDRKSSADCAAVRERQFADMLARAPARDRGGEARDAEPLAEVRQGPDDVVVEGHMGERLAVLPRVEMEMGEAHRVAHAPVHDVHRQDGLRFRFDRLPGADPLEEPPRPLGDRDRAQRRLMRSSG